MMRRRLFFLILAMVLIPGSGLFGNEFTVSSDTLGVTTDTLVAGQAVSSMVSKKAINPSVKTKSAPLAAGKSKFLGCEWDTGQSTDFMKYFNQSTPGNAGKWATIEGTRDVMTWNASWASLDLAYNTAWSNNIPFKQHTLFWGAQQPTWLASLDSANQRAEIIEWLQGLATRYDSFAYIDVCNEPLHNAPNGMTPWGATTPNINYAKALGGGTNGAGVTGYDWIIEAFRLARQYFPKAKLLINEYSVINDANATREYVKVIKLLQAENLIDGIGEQGHAFTTYGTSSETLKTNLDALAETGLPIYITELDIDGPTDLQQLAEYQRVFKLLWEHPAVQGITLWGFRYPVWRNDEGAYLVTSSGVERPAFNWLKAYVNDTLTMTDSIAVYSSAANDSVILGETLQMSNAVFPANTTIKNVNWTVTPATLATISSKGVLTPVANGKVTVKASAWDGSGVTGTKEITIYSNLVQSITVSSEGNVNTLGIGRTLQMSASVLPADAYNPSYKWKTVPTSVATISQTGMLSALLKGTVKVIATANDGSGVADTLEIQIVDVMTESIEITGSAETLNLGDILQLGATVLPSDITYPGITWSSTPAELATVNRFGKLFTTAAGTVYVIATATDGSGVADTVKITIINSSTGIDIPWAEKLAVYPNPATGGAFTITGMDQVTGVDILRLDGKQIETYRVDHQPSLDVQLSAGPGLYIIKISNGTNAVYKKMVVL